ncbi:hypothetical protein WR25_16484 [Diploscapter pachys]|uniref:Uncharacterized protein n=1 Tax=Diploscapter pachys TaxID=2018661 RepID=A0A2A2J900_9BILA|nr:hypothetical protein WR25_16484 [Diploscapter pachys]
MDSPEARPLVLKRSLSMDLPMARTLFDTNATPCSVVNPLRVCFTFSVVSSSSSVIFAETALGKSGENTKYRDAVAMKHQQIRNIDSKSPSSKVSFCQYFATKCRQVSSSKGKVMNLSREGGDRTEAEGIWMERTTRIP